MSRTQAGLATDLPGSRTSTMTPGARGVSEGDNDTSGDNEKRADSPPYNVIHETSTRRASERSTSVAKSQPQRSPPAACSAPRGRRSSAAAVGPSPARLTSHVVQHRRV